MDLIEKGRNENTPYLQLLMLIGYAIAGILVFSLIAALIIIGVYGTNVLVDPSVLSGAESRYLPVMQILLVATSLGFFLVPALLLAITEGRNPLKFYGFKKPDIKLVGLVILIMIVSMPFMEWTTVTNGKMILPDFLKSIEKWIRQKETETMQTTLLLLKMIYIKDLIINLFMIALLPAISEELMFRGGLQRTFYRMFKNPHIAIWLSAAIFSAIHVQFYGFLPRMLLGACFGYIYFWSGNLWYSMLGHFLNNAYAVCAAWYMQKNNMSISEAENTTNFVWYGYLISFVLTILIILFFKRQTTNDQQLGKGIHY